MQVLLLIIIILLAGYIIFLQLQLVRKNILIESIVKKISGTEKNLSTEEIKRFINELHTYNVKSSIAEERLYEDKVLNFILGNEINSRTYIHYTMEESIARSILTEGFKFADTFHRTALPVSNDRLDLIVKHNSKKYFGNYIIVINISGEIVNRYSSEIEMAGITNYSFENVLTESPAEKNENSDNIFLLPVQYIKGYINYRTGELFTNPLFNPSYSSQGFSKNIDRLKTKSNHNKSIL